MKLEAVNGNLLSLTLQQQHQQEQQLKEEKMLVDDDKDNVDKEIEEERQNGETTDEKDINGGKKKGVRKKRSLNWEEAERSLLLEIIKPKVEFVENRSVEAKNIKSKRLAWMQITKQFNLLNFRHRSLEQIQVQWRSMKNSAKRDYQLKHDKAEMPEPMDMIEFMEEMQKEPTNVRGTRGGGGGGGVAANKKDISDSVADSDEEDTPLAALPTSTNNSDDTLQSSTIAIPSPPASAAESQSESYTTPTRMRRKQNATTLQQQSQQQQQHQQQQQQPATVAPQTNAVDGGTNGTKMRKQRKQSSTNVDAMPAAAVSTDFNATTISQLPNATISTSPSAFNTNAVIQTLAGDEKYRKQLFNLVKRARLADMEYARREHEQRLRHEELKWNLCRQQEELKIRNLREEHETRMRQYREEHETRMLAYAIPAKRLQTPKTAGNAVN